MLILFPLGGREERFGSSREERFGGSREERFGGSREERFGGSREERFGGSRMLSCHHFLRSENDENGRFLS